MQVGWLLDEEMFPHYQAELISAIESLGHQVKLVHAPQPPFRWDDVDCSYRDTFPADHCVIAHGDIGFMNRIRDDRRWRPGVFATIENFFCSHYVTYLGDYWLNRDYTMLPFGDLKRQQQFLFDSFGVDGKIFVRPDSPLKLFTGQTASDATFDADLEYMGFYEFPSDSLVVVSRPKIVEREWRFVAANQEIVTGCLYAKLGESQLSPEVDRQAEELAAKIASLEFNPDPVWIIDICQTADGGYHLLEVGGFSFADWYVCDKTEIVRAASSEAVSVWQSQSS